MDAHEKITQAEKAIEKQFKIIDEIRNFNQRKVLKDFMITK